MKRFFYILPLLLLTACQQIREEEQLIQVDPGELRSNRTTLICEFSGLNCVNCPTAAEEAHRMLELWPNNLVVVEIHPASNPFCQTKKAEYDYTCPAAEVYYKAFGGTETTPFPTGIINLKGDFTAFASWGGAFVASEVEQATVELSAETTYDATTRQLSAEVTLRNLQDAAQELRLIGWLTEDSIVGGQRMPDNTVNKAYVHNHLLRDTLTAAWGEPVALPKEGGEAGLRICYTLPEKCNAAHCNVVLLALRDDEVVQAKQVKIEN